MLGYNGFKNKLANHKQMKGYRLFFLILICCLWSASSRGDVKFFPLPRAGEEMRWEAEDAKRTKGLEVIKHPWASGNAYVKPIYPLAPSQALEFPFHTTEPVALQIHPIWWKHGEREPARLFPYPLPAQPGPDKLDVDGNLLFFTAPMGGEVGVVDTTTDNIYKEIEVGGYLSDLAVDTEHHKLYVLDAKGDRLVIFDSQSLEKVGESPLPGCPWSCVIYGGNLFIACWKAKMLVVVDTSSDKIVKQIPLPFEPLNVSIFGTPPRLVVYPFPKMFSLETLEEISPEEERYSIPPHTKAQWPMLQEPKEELLAPSKGILIIRQILKTQKGTEYKDIPVDVSPLGKEGPKAIDVWKDYAFFVSPPDGKIGVVDVIKGKLVNSIEVGGFPTDLVVDKKNGRIYVIDSQGKKLIVVDADKQRIIHTLQLPATPQKVGIPSPPDVSWWPLIPSDRVLLVHRPRLIVQMAPLAFALPSLEETDVRGVPESFAKKNKVVVKLKRELTTQEDIKPIYYAPKATPIIDGDLGEWSNIPSVSLPTQQTTPLSQTYPDYQGDKDLKARFYICWDEKNLYFAAQVDDDIFHQPYADENIWQGDCIQIAFDILECGSYDREYGFALTDGKPFVWCWYGPPEDKEKIKLEVKKQKGTLNYEASIPWDILPPFKPSPSQTLGFTVAFMDSDGKGREGDIEWTAGIVREKNANAFGRIALVQDLSPSEIESIKKTLALTKTYTADNNYTLQIATGEKQSWLDVSSITEKYFFSSPSPLSPLDLPGTITLSVDDGPQYPWRKDVWLTEQGIFLKNETEEFWRYNAPVFFLPPGQHTVKVWFHSPFAYLDALAVRKTLSPIVSIKISSQPSENYGVFYDKEPVVIRIELQNKSGKTLTGELNLQVKNYMNEVIETRKKQIEIPPHNLRTLFLYPRLKDWGRHILQLSLKGKEGETSSQFYFLRLPKLEHPRLLFRKEEIPEIQKRISQHPLLFERFASYLKEASKEPGFLPLSLNANRAIKEGTAWRRYDLAWHMLACQFADLFLAPPNDSSFKEALSHLLQDKNPSEYVTFHHHGPFFPGAECSLFDMKALYSEEARKSIQHLFASRSGDMNLLPWTLVSLEEPLTPQKRLLLSKIMVWLFNWDNYFAEHCGKRGGTWWLNPRTWCHCAIAGYMWSAIYMRNFFGEKRLMDKKFFSGFFTFHNFVNPYIDKDNFFGLNDLHEPLGEPGGRLAIASLSKNPLEKRFYDFDRWFKELEDPLLTKERVGQLFKEERKRMVAPHLPKETRAVEAIVAPIALALGWYEIGSPEFSLEELPPTVLFDREGWVVMRSGWDEELTEVHFISGIRDHVYRHRANDIMLAKAGEFLLGTGSLSMDDGGPGRFPGNSWGNVVVVEPSDGASRWWEADWASRWWENLWHIRGEEYFIFNRFSAHNFQRIARDERIANYHPAEGGYGGGLDLHGHTESPLMQEGEIIAYETSPEFDYVAGDATNAWLPSEVEENYRQLVFIKPDVVVIYDRIKLGPKADRSYWLCATYSQPIPEGDHFSIKGGISSLYAKVLLPQNPSYKSFPASSYKGLFDPNPKSLKQWVLEIHPTHPMGPTQEYLLLLKVGKGQVQPLEAKPVLTEEQAGCEFSYQRRRVKLLFNRKGIVGGHIQIVGEGVNINRSLAEQVIDDYRYWSKDKRYKKWLDYFPYLKWK